MSFAWRNISSFVCLIFQLSSSSWFHSGGNSIYFSSFVMVFSLDTGDFMVLSIILIIPPKFLSYNSLVGMIFRSDSLLSLFLGKSIPFFVFFLGDSTSFFTFFSLSSRFRSSFFKSISAVDTFWAIGGCKSWNGSCTHRVRRYLCCIFPVLMLLWET